MRARMDNANSGASNAATSPKNRNAGTMPS